jgi:hypothetical protein
MNYTASDRNPNDNVDAYDSISDEYKIKEFYAASLK